MPDPVVDAWKVHVEIQGVTGLPRDRYVNTFCFRKHASADEDTQLGLIRALLADFYVTDTGAGATERTILEHMSGRHLAAGNNTQIKCYALWQGPPRVPDVLTPLALDPPESADALPAEVAICASFHGETPSSPNQRGRVYIGPLSTTGFGHSSTTGDVEPSANLRDTVAAASKRLADDSQDDGISWCILSRTTQQLHTVVGGFVDNAVDIQRRRGHRPSMRKTWVAA